MMKAKQRYVYSLALYCFSSLAMCGVATAELPHSASDGWKKLQQAVTTDDLENNGLKIGYKYSVSISKAGAKDTNSFRILELGLSRRGSYVKKVIGTQTAILVENPKHAFGVEPQDSGNKFNLTDIQRGATADGIRTVINDVRYHFMTAGFEIMGKTMPDLVSSTRFVMQSLDVDEEHNTATLVFDYDREDRRDETAMTGGTITFHTDKLWAISEYDCRTFWGRVRGTVKYIDFANALAPQFLRIEVMNKAGDGKSTEIYELLNINRLRADESLPVTLADYGLSEPTFSVTP